MKREPASTLCALRLRERSTNVMVMVAPVGFGEGDIELLVGNELLKQHQAD